ncbi:MAG: FapA family protein [Planctomycetota bacterium]
MNSLGDTLQITITSDRLGALLAAQQSAAPEAMCVAEIVKLLKQYGVCHGVDEVRVAQFLEKWRREAVEEPFMVANGTPPISGRLRELRRLPPPARNGKDPVELLPLFVKEGDLVFAIEEAKSGTPGTDVYGKPCEPSPPEKDILPNPGAGFKVDEKIWRAVESGFLEDEGGTIRISKTLLHKRDLPAAEYEWPGDARVEGTLLAGATMRLGGNLDVNGGVQEHVTIETAGQLNITGKVAGGGSTRLTAGGTVRIGELHRCTLMTEGDIHVARDCFDCHCMCGGLFHASERGSLVTRSRIEALRGAIFYDLGESKPHQTKVAVGWSRWLDEEQQALEGAIRRWQLHSTRLVDSFRGRFEHILEKRDGDSPISEKDLRDFEDEKARVLWEQQRVEARLTALRAQQARLESMSRRDDTARVLIQGTAYPGTQVSIRGRDYTFSGAQAKDVTLIVFPETSRVHAVPTEVFNSSAMGATGILGLSE